MTVGTPVERLIQKAYDNLKTSDAASAAAALKEALRQDYENQEVVFALKCVQWWQERINRKEGFPDDYERGGYILSQWRAFYSFLDRISGGQIDPDSPSAQYDNCLYAVKRFVYSSALHCFQDILGEGVNQHDPELLLEVGRCYKGVGNYEQALNYLEQAIRFKREDGGALAELADVNALLEDSRAAKALFREAFFKGPQDVDIRSMESELILRLAGKVHALGYKGPELLEWIPVFGCLFGVFTVKRELKPVELGRLKQSIFSLENEIRGRPDNMNMLRPHLLNRYFWLIDHYENVQADPGLIEETLLKIKIIDPDIYTKYIR
jgi:tetratricopeptide (TPR) repeat protein